jgi:hypothetical protein
MEKVMKSGIYMILRESGIRKIIEKQLEQLPVGNT